MSKEIIIKCLKKMEADFGLHNFIEFYRNPKNPYFRLIKILKERYGVVYNTTVKKDG